MNIIDAFLLFPLPFLSLCLPFAGAAVLLAMRLYHRLIYRKSGEVMSVARVPMKLSFLLLLLVNVVMTYIVWVRFRSSGSMVYAFGGGGWTSTLSPDSALRAMMQVDSLGTVSAFSMSIVAFIAGLRALADKANPLTPTKTAFYLLTLCGVQGIFYSNDLLALTLFLLISQAGATGLYRGVPAGRGEMLDDAWYLASRLLAVAMFLCGTLILFKDLGSYNITTLAASQLKRGAPELSALVLLAAPLLFLFMKNASYVTDAGRRCFFGIRAQAAFFALFRVLFSLYGPLPGLEKIPVLCGLLGAVMFCSAVLTAAGETDPLKFAESMELFMKGFMLAALSLGLSGTYSAESVARYGGGALESMVSLWIIYLPLSAALSIICCRLKDTEDGVELWRINGLGSRLPVTCAAMVLVIFAMAGLPPLTGYASKQLLYRASEYVSPLLVALLFIASMLQLLFGTRYLVSVFFGRASLSRDASRVSDSAIILPLLLLLLLFGFASLLPEKAFQTMVTPTSEALIDRGVKTGPPEPAPAEAPAPSDAGGWD